MKTLTNFLLVALDNLETKQKPGFWSWIFLVAVNPQPSFPYYQQNVLWFKQCDVQAQTYTL